MKSFLSVHISGRIPRRGIRCASLPRRICASWTLLAATLFCAAAPLHSGADADTRLPVTRRESGSGKYADWRTMVGSAPLQPAPPGVPQPISEAIAPPPQPLIPETPAAPDSVPQAQPAPDAGTEQRIVAIGVETTGDSDVFAKLGLLRQAERDMIAKLLTEREIIALADGYRQSCIKAGYYLAAVKPTLDIPRGIVVLQVDKGRVGKTAVYEGGFAGDHREPFAQRYFTEAHVRRMLSRIREGDTFDYNDFYSSMFRINSHPDLVIDADLKLRRESENGIPRRYADIDFLVKENRPLHGILEVKNSGTRDTGQWRLSGTVQHLNLTKHGDILTFNTLASMDFKSLLSIAGSYNRPYYLGNGGSLTIYGGWSSVEAKEVAPVIDLLGSGWFACLQTSYDLVSTERNLLSVSISGTRRTISSTISMRTDTTFEDCENVKSSSVTTPEETRKITILPATIGISWSSVKPDRFGGRNFLTFQSSLNLGDTLGSSGSDELSAQRAGAVKNYFVERIQAARLQPLFGTRENDGPVRGQWLLFAKADAQFSRSALVPAEQKSIGGMDSVRGYPEREALGDNGVSGTLELRSPIFSGFLPRFSRKTSDDPAGNNAFDHVQAVVFVDAGRVSLSKPVEGTPDSASLLGAGAGLRMAVTGNSQLKLDWGFPLKKTAHSSPSGQGHVSLQMQF